MNDKEHNKDTIKTLGYSFQTPIKQDVAPLHNAPNTTSKNNEKS